MRISGQCSDPAFQTEITDMLSKYKAKQ